MSRDEWLAQLTPGARVRVRSDRESPGSRWHSIVERTNSTTFYVAGMGFSKKLGRHRELNPFRYIGGPAYYNYWIEPPETP